MEFNITKCLNSLSLALDFAEAENSKICHNHSQKLCYFTLQIANAMKLPIEEQKDLYILSLLHDSGITTAENKSPQKNDKYYNLAHCEEGEKNISLLNLIKNRKNIIKFHHENYDGSGIYKIKGEEIPLLSQIIHFCHDIITYFDLEEIEFYDRENVKTYALMNNNKLFSPSVVSSFITIANKDSLWLDLAFNNTTEILDRISPCITCDYTWNDILKISEVFMKIIDKKSKYTTHHSKGINHKAAIMSDYYNIDDETQKKLLIAANFHDIGKLYIPNSILDKPKKLNSYEMSEVHKHTYYTKLVLDRIPGFEVISKWASSHHEKLNGNGYPEKLTSSDLDFESRLLCIIDIYQALTENKPYRKKMTHHDAMDIIYDMAGKGQLDIDISINVDKAFENVTSHAEPIPTI